MSISMSVAAFLLVCGKTILLFHNDDLVEMAEGFSVELTNDNVKAAKKHLRYLKKISGANDFVVIDE